MRHLELIEKTLSESIPDSSETLYQAARYSLLNGGKRLRPALVLMTTEALGGDIRKALLPAVALEMMHTYSLIHDDLPCMDDDDFRRGVPTLHKKYSEAIAVLAGDYLLTRAFELLADAPDLSAEQKTQLVKSLSQRGNGMVLGQVHDIAAEGHLVDLATLSAIHKNKTGQLMKCALEFGGICAGYPDIQALGNLGEELGLAHQIIDDVIDQSKRAGTDSTDLDNNKSTYVKLLGINDSREKAMHILKGIHQQLHDLSLDRSGLMELTEACVCRIK